MCDWCGHDHAITALCPSAPRARGMNRRSFLYLGAATVIAAAAPSFPLADIGDIGEIGLPYDPARFAKEVESLWRVTYVFTPTRAVGV